MLCISAEVLDYNLACTLGAQLFIRWLRLVHNGLDEYLQVRGGQQHWVG
jgi:hypothetical protein